VSSIALVVDLELLEILAVQRAMLLLFCSKFLEKLNVFDEWLVVDFIVKETVVLNLSDYDTPAARM
jgi:hypothetical protein